MSFDIQFTPYPAKNTRGGFWRFWYYDLLLIFIVLAGAYFRSVGLNWDQNEHLHPDERFMTLVESAVTPVQDPARYFDTATSPLNPNNVGYGFYVYGTLPLILVRYVGQLTHQDGYGQIYLVGRQLSAFCDLLTMLLVYLIASRLYGRRTGVLATAFTAFSVLPIQLSHYFTVDTFTNFFAFVAFYYAVRVMLDSPRSFPAKGEEGDSVWEEELLATGNPDWLVHPERRYRWSDFFSRTTWFYVLFGLGFGLAMASKVSAAPMALLLPAGAAIYLWGLPAEEREFRFWPAVANLALAALVSFLVFRIFQPYAFTGPGFFDLGINPKWLASLRDLQAQSSADSDAPYALQWARRPITFAWTNMVLWGLGLPLGLTAWAAVVWMGWRIIHGEWQKNILIWVWTVGYFAWQAASWVRSMRYELLVYPTLAIIAAWGINRLWDCGKEQARKWKLALGGPGTGTLLRWLALAGGVVTVLGTLAWAFAFTRIYTRPVTRVAASAWVYQNVRGPLNAQIETTEGTVTQPLAYRWGTLVQPGQPLALDFQPQSDGLMGDIQLPHAIDRSAALIPKTLSVTVTTVERPREVLAVGRLTSDFGFSRDPMGDAYQLTLDVPIPVKQGDHYRLQIEIITDNSAVFLWGAPLVSIYSSYASGIERQAVLFPVQTISPSAPYSAQYLPVEGGVLRQISSPFLVDLSGIPGAKTLRLTVTSAVGGKEETATATVQSNFGAGPDPRGKPYTFILDKPLLVSPQQPFSVTIEMVAGTGRVGAYGAWPAIESPWDDPIPLGLGKYYPYDQLSGIYRGDLNFEMYPTDSLDKRQRFENILDQADYIFITSNRQWGTTVRVPERYPMTTAYYRELLGCPLDREVTWCYSVAQPGIFQAQLGFELVQVFQSDPNLGSLRINDQFAEEAFTVYDHPKVLIFKKTAQYSPAKVHAALDDVDLTRVIPLTPRKASGPVPGSSSLLLPAARLAGQQDGGTWSQLFNYEEIQNRYPGLGVALWYVVVLLLGWVVYPLVRLALPGLADHGYPLVRTAGMILLAYLVWLGGSLNIPATRMMITQVLLGMTLACGLIGYLTRSELAREIRERRNYFLVVEVLCLVFFTAFLLVRLGNPDLWHPAKGGEKPMDFSYFNAVIKSTTFPPYDPWYAGGYINYYYYGYVIVGVLVKLLGIAPSIAYNIILPTLFSMVALGAFSLGWNLIAYRRKLPGRVSAAGPADPPGEPDGLTEIEVLDTDLDKVEESPILRSWRLLDILTHPAFLIGLAAAIGVVVLGNLGTVRMIWYGFQNLVAPGGDASKVGVIQHWIYFFQGVVRYLSTPGATLPYGPGDWYWIPSRAISGLGDVDPITEFPYFTFLYADLHAHMIALPVTLLALSWVVSVALGKGRWGDPDTFRLGWLSLVLAFLLGGLTIGALRPTNTWDLPTYLLLGAAALGYTGFVYGFWIGKQGAVRQMPATSRRVILAGASILVLGGLAFLLYLPYAEWYRQAYNAIDLWKGTHTQFWSYLTHWGLFLFVIVSWMFYETVRWMAETPMSALLRLKPYAVTIEALVLAAVAVLVLLVLRGIEIALVVVPLEIWAAILIFRPGLPLEKRLVLFLTCTGLALTLFVELFVLRGDIGRMNTVFKFYLQVWILFGISAAAGLGWLTMGTYENRARWFSGWQVALTLLVAGAALYPVMATDGKIHDRMAPLAPHTLDGMTYMEYSAYGEPWGDMDLNQDYLAIRWLQDNAPGSYVLVEANDRNLYRWGSRMTIYTGLPGVVGWEWHQQQQRAVNSPQLVTNRILEVEAFYRTTDEKQAQDFLQKYNVKYIIVGQEERGMYAGPGIDKFAQWNSILWQEVYRNADTVIYQSACSCGSGSTSNAAPPPP
ncbi:MAG TPA: DUF2298 domain-containing protein [Anaerolineaceae bacterium]|nr:DUF2298 domain-containing protein [Anaerolineaceae bacterium]